MKIYQDFVDNLFDERNQNNEVRFVAGQLLEMHKESMSRKSPIIVELGVDKGHSTRVFLNSIDDKPDATLISVDIRDCSGAVECDNWNFLQADSADWNTIINSFPIIKNGIDILYVDSLHTPQHVMCEVCGFFPLVKKDGIIYFDDIDSSPYKKGQRKDSILIENANREILKLLDAIFQANLNDLDFTIIRGSTGLAKFTKKSSLGNNLKTPIYLEDRNFKLLVKIYNIIHTRDIKFAFKIISFLKKIKSYVIKQR
jgi:predicted O-methyltransferase YrrM